MRLSSIKFSSQSDKSHSVALSASFAASAVVFALILSGKDFLQAAPIEDSILLYTYVVGQAALDVTSASLRSKGQPRRMFILTAVRVAAILIGCAVAYAARPTGKEIAFLFFAPSVLVAIPIIVLNIFKALSSHRRDAQVRWRRLRASLSDQFKFSIPIVVANGLYAFTMLQGRYALSASSDAGYFMYLSDLSQRSLMLLSGLLGTLSLQWLIDAGRSAERSEIRTQAIRHAASKALNLQLVLLVPSVVGLAVCSDLLIRVLTPWPSWPSVMSVSAALCASYAVYAIIQYWLQAAIIARGNSKSLLIASIITFAVVFLCLSSFKLHIDAKLVALTQLLGLSASALFLVIVEKDIFFPLPSIRFPVHVIISAAATLLVTATCRLVLINNSALLTLLITTMSGVAAFALTMTLLNKGKFKTILSELSA